MRFLLKFKKKKNIILISKPKCSYLHRYKHLSPVLVRSKVPAVFFFPRDTFGLPVTIVQNPGKMGKNARDNFDQKNARDNFCNARDKYRKFLPVTKKNGRDNFQKVKICP